MNTLKARSFFWLAGILASASITMCAAADFAVTSPSVFAINGMNNNPTITLVRGRIYTFAVSTASFHPFVIGSALGTPQPGVVNNNSSSATMTFSVPTNAVNYVYYCNVHFFSGTILTVAPPTPPVPQIVSWSISNNIVLRTAPATNTFTVIPEYKTNLNNTNWVALTVQSNRFVNGTNETFCGRPPGTNLFIRVTVQ